MKKVIIKIATLVLMLIIVCYPIITGLVVYSQVQQTYNNETAALNIERRMDSLCGMSWGIMSSSATSTYGVWSCVDKNGNPIGAK